MLSSSWSVSQICIVFIYLKNVPQTLCFEVWLRGDEKDCIDFQGQWRLLRRTETHSASNEPEKEKGSAGSMHCKKKERKNERKNLWTHCRWRSRNLLCFLGKSFLYMQLKQLAWFWCITLKWFTWLTIHVIHVIYEHYDPGPRRALFLEQYFGILGVVLLFIADVLIG